MSDTPGVNIQGTNKKGFVNTGGWVESYSRTEGQVRPHDTFAYIDENGPQLLQWDDITGTAHEFE